MRQSTSGSPNVLWLADFRGRNASDDDRPPPSPEPAAARRPVSPDIADAIGQTRALPQVPAA